MTSTVSCSDGGSLAHASFRHSYTGIRFSCWSYSAIVALSFTMSMDAPPLISVFACLHCTMP